MPATTKKTIAKDILAELEPLGAEGYKKILLKHGVAEPVWGVKIEYLKKIQKRVKTDYQLALDLYDSGVYDAMYLAGLIADDAKMTRKDLTKWAKNATSDTLCSYTVPGVAAGNPLGREIALEWIDDKTPRIAATGWTTMSLIVAVTEDAELDLDEIRGLLKRVGKTIHAQGDRVRYAMNCFVISVGCYVAPLTALAEETARAIGKVEVDMGETACKVPDALAYIDKVRQRGTIGKKRKSAKC
jgi:3-methyladenine DNA glycosylase AlkD